MPKETNDVVVLGRTGYGENWVPMFRVNAENNKHHTEEKSWDSFVSLDAAKTQAIDYIRKHREGGQRMEYRIKEAKSGKILD